MSELTGHLKVHQLRMILYYWNLVQHNDKLSQAERANALVHANEYRRELLRRTGK